MKKQPIMSLDRMAALILPWAKEKEPDKYEATLRVSGRPETFRRYMARLVEIRWEQEPAWRDVAPVALLDETALEVKMRHPDSGREIVVKGRLAGEREWGFSELEAAYKAGFDLEKLLLIKEGFNLVIDDA